MRNTGISGVGEAPWGTHFCQFYRNRQDLADILVPYFKAGLEANEFCMWVTSPDFTTQEAEAALRRVVPDLDRRRQAGQIEILPYTDWYLKDGAFDMHRVLNGWVQKMEQAVARGFDGLRQTGNTVWIEKQGWKDFTDYEQAVIECLGRYRILALCTYSLHQCGALEILDVVRNHQFALISTEKGWQIIEGTDEKRKQAEMAVAQSQKTFSDLVERAPFGIYVVDSHFRIAQMNAGSQTGAFRNVRPVLGRDFAEAMRILWPEPVAAGIIAAFRHTLETGEPYYSPRFLNPRHDVETVEAYEWELHRMTLPDGQYGVICYYFDSTKLRTAEQALRESEERYRTLFNTLIEGFCIIEVMFDDRGKPVDYRFLEINPAFEKQTGLHDAEGKRMRELAPNHEEHWFEIYGRVALTGEPAHFENAAKALGRFFEVYAFRVGGPESRKVGIAFNDITQRKRVELEIRQRAEELRASNEELMRFNRGMVGRELRMVELKKEINELCRECGQPARYRVDLENEEERA